MFVVHQEYRKQFNLEPLVKDDTDLQETGRVRATVRVIPGRF